MVFEVNSNQNYIEKIGVNFEVAYVFLQNFVPKWSNFVQRDSNSYFGIKRNETGSN